MKATGPITIEEGLILTDPTMEIVDIRYPYPETLKKMVVEVNFKVDDSTYSHSRSYTFDTEGNDLIYSDALLLLKTHDVLKDFN